MKRILPKVKKQSYKNGKCVFKSPESLYYVETWSIEGWDLDREFNALKKAIKRKDELGRTGRVVRITDNDNCYLGGN